MSARTGSASHPLRVLRLATELRQLQTEVPTQMILSSGHEHTRTYGHTETAGH